MGDSARHFLYIDYPGLKGFVDRMGKVAIQAAFADVGPFRGGLARAALDGYCHLAGPDGKEQGSPTSGYPTSCGGRQSDAVSPCRVGFIDTAGRFAVQPVFEAARYFQENLAAVRIGRLWGFIDTKGRVVVPPRFQRAQSFRDGLAAVRVDGKWGFIDQRRRPDRRAFSRSNSVCARTAAILLTETHVKYINHAGAAVFAYDRRPR